MKVALVHPNFVDTGSERYIWSLAHRLAELDIEVHVFASRFGRGMNSSITCHSIPDFSFPRSLRPYFFSVLSYRAITRSSYDIVHGFGKTNHQNIYTEGSGLTRSFAAYQDARIPRYAQLGRGLSPVRQVALKLERRRYIDPELGTILFMSHALKREFRECYGLSDKKTAVVYSAVDCDRFAPNGKGAPGIRDRLGISARDLVLLMVGNDFHRKNVDSAVQALARLTSNSTRSYHLLVIGRDRSTRMQSIAQQLGVASRTHFLGPRADVQHYYGAADILLHPARFDAFGIVVLEAMASGLPVIVSRSAGSHEIVDHLSEGLLLDDCESVPALTEAARHLSEPGERTRMGEAARAKAERFDWSHHIDQILAFYEEIAAG